MFLPAAIVETAAQALVLSYTPLGSLVGVAGDSSLLSATVALLVAGAGHVLAAALVLGGVAALLDAADAGRPARVRDAVRLLAGRAWALLGTVGLATLAIASLAITIVGIPWAVHLLGRWAVCVPACAIERLGPRSSLRRSRELIRGRWWRAARLSVAVNLVAAVSGPVAGIVLLFVSALPLATINAVSSGVYVMTMPFAGAAIALLWGDLVARRRGGTEV